MSVSIDAYRNINVGTASPKQIIVKLYGGAARYLEDAEQALAQGEPHDEPLKKARMIVAALMSSLDFQAGEMAENLLKLYLFVLDRIQVARTEQEGAGLAEARKVLETLKAGWEEMSPPDGRQGPLGPARSARVNLQG